MLAALLAVGTAILSGGPLSTPSPSVVRWTGVAAPPPLEMAVQKAGERAAAWQADAVLVRVEAAFRPGSRWLEAQTLPVTWMFTYYSPSARALATVGINAGKVFWIPPLEVPGAPHPLPSFPPPYGADKMWLTFRGAGGEEFLRQHSGAMVYITLQMADGIPVWEVGAVEEKAHLSVRIHAETGTVLP